MTKRLVAFGLTGLFGGSFSAMIADISIHQFWTAYIVTTIVLTLVFVLLKTWNAPKTVVFENSLLIALLLMLGSMLGSEFKLLFYPPAIAALLMAVATFMVTQPARAAHERERRRLRREKALLRRISV